MSNPSPSQEPDVQGLPGSLMSSLYGMAALLLAAGALCELLAAWERLHDGVKLVLLLLPSALALSLHALRVRRKGEPFCSGAFAAFMAANLIALPLGAYLAVHVWALFGAPFALLYAVAMLWYGAYYHSAAVHSAACALAFAGAMSIPVCYGVGAVASGMALLMLGLVAWIAARAVRRKREEKLALMRLARRRQELSRQIEGEE